MMVKATFKTHTVRSAAGPVTKADGRLEVLYAEHGSKAARLAYLLTGDRDVVEDIVHEAFVRVGRRLTGLKDPSKSAGYLYRTVANLSKGHGRSLARNRKLREKVTPAAPSTQPDLEARDEIRQALMKLPPRQRMALYRRHYLDLSEAEAAEAMDLSVSAMKSLTHRAAESCRKHLSGVER